MHDEDRVTRRQGDQALAHPFDLVSEALAVRWPVGRRLLPERAIVGAELGFDLVMPAPGPGTEVLLAQALIGNRRDIVKSN